MKEKFLNYFGYVIFAVFIIFKVIKVLFRDQLKSSNLFMAVFGIFFILISAYVVLNLRSRNHGFIYHSKYRLFTRLFDETGVKIFYYILAIFFLFLGIGLVYTSVKDYIVALV